MNLLASKNRPELIKKLQDEVFDLIIIGGGITGAGIALDASSRGLKVALVEMKDFASGTSSKSTKLVHGGLRYLKQLEFSLVREVGQERAIVHHLAPHLTTAEKMILPIIQNGTYGRFASSIGLMVYDFLADVEEADKRRMISKEEVLKLEPQIKEEDLLGGGVYAEYRTDDSRLTIEIIKQAYENGTLSINYVKAKQFTYENGKVSGIECLDMLNEQSFLIQSQYIVSAAGPWVDRLRKKDKSLKGKRLFLSKGAHLVIPHERLPLKHAVYFDVPDGRMMFAIPRHRITYLGTTDTPYDGDINNVIANRADAEYILKGVNSRFPTAKLTLEDVESSWAGLRPLIFEDGKSASEMSRKDEIFESKSGLISIAGGKLTGYRKMAERIVDLVIKKFEKNGKRSFSECHTDKITLGKSYFQNAREVIDYQLAIENQISQKGLKKYHAQYLVANYGRQTEKILEHLHKFDNPAEISLARAELVFCLENELCITPLDFFTRRTGRLFFNLPSIPIVLENVLEDFGKYFDWDEEKKQHSRVLVQQAIFEASEYLKVKNEI